MSNNKKNVIDKFLESRLGKIIGTFAIAYFLLQAFGVNLTQYNIIFKFLIIYVSFLFFIEVSKKYIDKKIKELKSMLKDIRTIRNLKNDINKIKIAQERILKDKNIIYDTLEQLRDDLDDEIMRLESDIEDVRDEVEETKDEIEDIKKE